MKDFNLDNRRYVIGGVAILIVVVYIVRLFMFQLVSDDYRKSADSNAFLKRIEFPSSSVIAMASCWFSTNRPMTSWW